jgi:hypothetical protein
LQIIKSNLATIKAGVALFAVIFIVAVAITGYYLVSKTSPPDILLSGTPTPTGSPLPLITPEPYSTPTPTPIVTVTPTPTPSSNVESTPTPTPTPSPTPISKPPTPTPSPTPTIKYVLTYSSSPPSGGTVSATPSASASSYASGTSVTLTATANSGYRFDHFTVDSVAITTNPSTVTMNSVHTIIAYFTLTPTPTPIPTPKPVILSSVYSEWPSGFYRYFKYDVTVRNDGGSGSITVYAEIRWPNTITLSKTQNVAAGVTSLFTLQTSVYLQGNVTSAIITKEPWTVPP